MSQMVSHQGELVRINVNKNCIEYSTNDGRSWHGRSSKSIIFEFQDLTDNGNELLASTTKGLYYSKNKGASWHKR
ncbi:hypothetical protein [Flavobacterium yafengii]|uniref:hypothetical protein n=1 Tax=Flavobacterium yafengii TaxID=3041253 RepID=UPI0024A8E63A|nr:hypothetical protein [Flavobacterium yafengii]MDI6047506.1 hypothetical protein [Flavobacterium yafengii]